MTKLNHWKHRHKVRYYNLLTSEKLYDYLADIEEQAENMFSRLVNISDDMKPARKKKITFEPDETSLIVHCLTDWLNNQIQAEKQTVAEVIGELLIKFTG